jgi:hypothetical protein
VAESIEQFGFELTASAPAEQERALTGLRARAGTVNLLDGYRIELIAQSPP